MYFTIDLLLHVLAQSPSSRSYANVVKTYGNTLLLYILTTIVSDP